ncbi:hypothetical protein HZ326_28702 [Fusarium oxysporum f. sp. albedinis]|nr:hypothetical protein HZ326_28702 [Fusarium oxysporum f. sp. albedinis]
MPIPSLFEISATMPPAGGGNASALLLECYATLADEHMFARRRDSLKAKELAVFAATGLDTYLPHGITLLVLLALTILFTREPGGVFYTFAPPPPEGGDR